MTGRTQPTTLDSIKRSLVALRMPRALEMLDATLRLVEEGDSFDLGDRVLEVLHVPGRSAGGLALFEEATGSHFTSDMLYDGEHGDAWPPYDPQADAANLRRMRELPVRRVYPGRCGKLDRARKLVVNDAQLRDLAG